MSHSIVTDSTRVVTVVTDSARVVTMAKQCCVIHCPVTVIVTAAYYLSPLLSLVTVTHL